MGGHHGLLPKDTSWEKYALSLCLSLTRVGLGKPRKGRDKNWNANLIVKNFGNSAPILSGRDN